MRTKYTQASFSNKVDILTHGEFTVVGQYRGFYKKVLLRHNIKPVHTCKVIPFNFVRAQRCTKCHYSYAKNRHFERILHKLTNNEYSLVSNFINMSTKVILRHNTKYPHLFVIVPNSFVHRHARCPLLNHICKNTSQFNALVKELVGGKYDVVGTYVNRRTKIAMRHNTKHPHIFMIAPYIFLKNPHCTICMKRNDLIRRTNKFKKEVYDLVGDKYTVLGIFIN